LDPNDWHTFEYLRFREDSVDFILSLSNNYLPYMVVCNI
jgi:hypothetical protein